MIHSNVDYYRREKLMIRDNKYHSFDHTLSDTLSPKGYKFLTNIHWDKEGEFLHSVSYYTAIKNALADCGKTIDLVVREKSYGSTQPRNEPSVHILKSQRYKIGAFLGFVDNKIDPLITEKISREGYGDINLPAEVVIPVLREAVFEAVKLGMI